MPTLLSLLRPKSAEFSARRHAIDEPNEQDDDKSPKRYISWEDMKRQKLSQEDIARIKEQAQRDVDEKLGIQELVLRLKTETVDELTRQAEDEGIILGALLRRILEEHVDRRENSAS